MERIWPIRSHGAYSVDGHTKRQPPLYPLMRVVSIFVLLACLFGAQAQAWGAITDNLVAGYKLDEASGNAVDVLGANNLTESGGTIDAVTGKVNGARDFEPTQYFAGTGFTPTTGARSCSFWINLRSAPGTNQSRVICALGTLTGTEHRNFTIDYRNQSGTLMLELAWYDQIGFEEHRHPITLILDQWYHVVWTWTPATHTSTIYVYGEESTPSFAGSRTPGTDGTQSFQIGAFHNDTPWDGLIDEIYYWERAITADEVAVLYNGGNGRSYPFTSGAQHYYMQQSAVERDEEQFYAAIGLTSETDWRLVR